MLLHDVTSCLSIGDATSFEEVGNEFEAYLHEIKSDPNRLVPLDIPYKTHLNLLGTAFDLSRTSAEFKA